MSGNIEDGQMMSGIEIAGHLRRPDNENLHSISPLTSGHFFDVADAVAGLRRGLLLRTGWTLLGSCPAHGAAPAADWWAVDLRSSPERERPALAPDGRLTRIPIDVPGAADLLAGRPTTADYATLYRNMSEHCAAELAAVATAVAERLPGSTVVGCSLGKDRTGVAVALLLSLVGLPEREILDADRAARAALGACPAASAVYARRRNVTEDEFGRRLAVGSSAVGALLTTVVERHGSAEGFLRAHGATSRTVDALRRALVG
ncbi:tyrosine-protein phosphatase [Streptomyces sp. NPDC001455]|uniref:tyrosine-protein phosphatase n=1 Tax=unclassified Streptomyces TaxID=2593676 RepID=UPI00332B4CB0